MLSKKYRFHSRGGIKYVYQEGKTFRGAKISLVSCENTKKYTRVAVVVSKKVEKLAVNRNRIRRRVYEVVRRNFEGVPKQRDYVFVVYSKDVAKMPFGELEKAVGELIEQSKVCYNRGNE